MRVAASIPIDPGPYSLRELVLMATAAASARWDHTSHILCQTANLYRPKDEKPYPISKFHPFSDENRKDHNAPRKSMSPAMLRTMSGMFKVVHASG